MLQSQEFLATFAIFSAGALSAAAMVILERRPKHEFTPHLIPTTLILYISIIIALLALVHLVNLVGIKTGV